MAEAYLYCVLCGDSEPCTKSNWKLYTFPSKNPELKGNIEHNICNSCIDNIAIRNSLVKNTRCLYCDEKLIDETEYQFCDDDHEDLYYGRRSI